MEPRKIHFLTIILLTAAFASIPTADLLNDSSTTTDSTKEKCEFQKVSLSPHPALIDADTSLSLTSNFSKPCPKDRYHGIVLIKTGGGRTYDFNCVKRNINTSKIRTSIHTSYKVNPGITVKHKNMHLSLQSNHSEATIPIQNITLNCSYLNPQTKNINNMSQLFTTLDKGINGSTAYATIHIKDGKNCRLKATHVNYNAYHFPNERLEQKPITWQGQNGIALCTGDHLNLSYTVNDMDTIPKGMMKAQFTYTTGEKSYNTAKTTYKGGYNWLINHN